jgi:uncharacterized protein YxeA
MSPEDYKPSRPAVIISIIVLSIFSIYVVKTILERKDAFSSGVRYTIGYTTEIYFTTSGRSIKYRYKVDGVEHTGNTPYAYNSQVPNGRYWVKFSIDKPNISTIYQDRPVSSTIKELPPNGLLSIPK